jgi:hypothetical protein
VLKVLSLRIRVQVSESETVKEWNIGISTAEYLNVLTLQLVDLQFFAIVRVALKPLLPTFPCFGMVVVSLMEKVSYLSHKSDTK